MQASLSVAAPGAAVEANWVNLLGANTAGNTTASGSTLGLSGINVTLSGTNNSVINVSVPAPFTYSGWRPFANEDIILSANQGSLMVYPVELPNVQFDRLIWPIHGSNATNSSGSHTISFWFGIYSKNVSTLSLVTSQSTSIAATHSGTVGSYSLYSGLRLVTMALTSTIIEGNYWIGFVTRSTSGGANGSYSLAYATQGGSNFVGHWSSAHNTTYQFYPGMGVYNTTTNGIPNSIAFADIRGSDLVVLRPAKIAFVSGTV